MIRPKDPRQHDERHLAFIRRLPCLVTLTTPVEAAHIRFGRPEEGKRHVGMGEKPSDMWTVPLSQEMHRLQHSMNEEDFWSARAIDPIRVARALFDVTGDIQAGEDIVRRYCKGLRWK